MAKVYYGYIVDEDFGPRFIKFGSYFPYPVKVCLNGHEFLLRQLAKAGLAHEALDNGLFSCADAALAQRIAAGLDERAVAGVFAKWISHLPHPFPPADRAAGYDYNLSILQAELALTQVFDRPLTGRQFCEQIIKDNVTLGHPSQLQLIFDRRSIKTTPGRFRTRIIHDGVIPSLHLDYKNTRIKQYHKLGRALRTETTINHTYDFAIGRALGHLAQLRKIGVGRQPTRSCASNARPETPSPAKRPSAACTKRSSHPKGRRSPGCASAIHACISCCKRESFARSCQETFARGNSARSSANLANRQPRLAYILLAGPPMIYVGCACTD